MRSIFNAISNRDAAMPISHFLIRTGIHKGRLPSVVYFDTIQQRHPPASYRVSTAVPANLQIPIDFVYMYIYISNNVLYEFHHIQIYKTSIDC